MTSGVRGAGADWRRLVHTGVNYRLKWSWGGDGVVVVVCQVLILCPVYLHWSNGSHIGQIWRWNWYLEI